MIVLLNEKQVCAVSFPLVKMAASLSLFIIGTFIIIVEADIFKLHPDYFADKPDCQDLNNTLYSKIASILKNGKQLNLMYSKIKYQHFSETIEVLPRNKIVNEIPFVPITEQTPLNGIYVNISFAFGDDPPFKSYLRNIEETNVLKLLNDTLFITRLDPLLEQSKVQIIYFPADESGKNMTFVYIEGFRCKSDGSTNRCWSSPSFCLGWEQYCIEADDQFSLCNNQESNPTIKYYKSSSLVDRSKLLWAEPDIMAVIEHEHAEAEIIVGEQYRYDWICLTLNGSKPRNVTDILCRTILEPYWIYSNLVDKYGNVKLLKTLG